MATEPMAFRLEVDPGGRGSKLYLNGEDVTRAMSIHSVYLTVGAQQPSRLLIETIAQPGVVEGVAEIEVVGPEVTQGEAVLAFLTNIDPEQMEKDMLEGGGAFTEKESVGQSFLRVLKEYVGGHSNGS